MLLWSCCYVSYNVLCENSQNHDVIASLGGSTIGVLRNRRFGCVLRSYLVKYFPIFLAIRRFQCVSIMLSPPSFLNNPSTRHRSTSRYRPKPLSQRNLLSAFFGLTSVVFLATALVEPRWFYVKGGKCSGHFIGVYKMLSLKSTDTLSKYFSFVCTNCRIWTPLISACLPTCNTVLPNFWSMDRCKFVSFFFCASNLIRTTFHNLAHSFVYLLNSTKQFMKEYLFPVLSFKFCLSREGICVSHDNLRTDEPQMVPIQV